MTEDDRHSSSHDRDDEGFGDLLKYTFAGYGGGLLVGALLDHFSLQSSPVGQWVVRTLSGEGESIIEGIYAVRQRLRQASGSMAEAYGWGKFLGIFVPWVIDVSSRQCGRDVDGVGGFFIPYFYALSDQIGANISGLIFLRKKEGSWTSAARRYVRHPVMLTSLLVILVVPLGLLVARILGFSPTTQVSAAAETIAANACWLPPLVGRLTARHQQGSGHGDIG